MYRYGPIGSQRDHTYATMIRVAVIISVLGLQIPVEPTFINYVTNVVVHETSIRVLGAVLDVDDSIILQQDVCISPFTVDCLWLLHRPAV